MTIQTSLFTWFKSQKKISLTQNIIFTWTKIIWDTLYVPYTIQFSQLKKYLKTFGHLSKYDKFIQNKFKKICQRWDTNPRPLPRIWALVWRLRPLGHPDCYLNYELYSIIYNYTFWRRITLSGVTHDSLGWL